MLEPDASRRALLGRRARLPVPALLAVAAAAVLFCLMDAPAYAGSSLRCGNRLVSDGAPIDEVFRRCGEPTFRSFSTEFVSFETPSGVVVTREVPVETWTYNRGPREFVRYLTFRNGHLVRVVEGDYGY
jgi:hypothetical protein